MLLIKGSILFYFLLIPRFGKVTRVPLSWRYTWLYLNQNLNCFTCTCAWNWGQHLICVVSQWMRRWMNWWKNSSKITRTGASFFAEKAASGKEISSSHLYCRCLLWSYPFLCFTFMWCNLVFLPCRSPKAKEEAQQYKLLYLGLYLLIWGEAANLRFMSECLCYIFHHVSETMRLLEVFFHQVLKTTRFSLIN